MKPGNRKATQKGTPTDTPKTPQVFLSEKHEIMSWGSMSKELEYNKGVLSAVANNQRRAPDKLIRAINKKYGARLPLNLQPAPVCSHCGNVPLAKRCPCTRKPSTTPRVNWKKAYIELLDTPNGQWKRLATWAASMLIYMEGER